MATALLPTSASQPRVAAKITGELRTFAMPFVHLKSAQDGARVAR
jgi:hypothetical protein